MQDRHLFEYAVLRIVPRVEREEFLNIGVILYCRDKKFLQSMFTLDEERLRIFCSMIDLDEVKQYLQAFDHICKGDKQGGPIAQMDMAYRFRWLAASRSTIIQASKIHPGLCKNPLDVLQELHAKLVL